MTLAQPGIEVLPKGACASAKVEAQQGRLHRRVMGALLGTHFGFLVVDPPPLVVASSSVVRVVAFLALVAGLMLATEWWPAVFAWMLFCASVTVYWLELPFATLDDYFASVFALVVALLLESKGPRRARVGELVELRNPTVALAVLLVLGLYVAGGPVRFEDAELLPKRHELWESAFRFAAVLLAIPSTVALAAGIGLAFCLHAYTAVVMGAWFTNAAIAATAALAWGETRRSAPFRFRLELGTVVGVAVTCVAAAGYVALPNMQTSRDASRRLLADVGLWPMHREIPRVPEGSVEVELHGHGTTEFEALSATGDARIRLAASRLLALDPHDPMATILASAVAQHFCGAGAGANQISKRMDEGIGGRIVMGVACESPRKRTPERPDSLHEERKP